MTRLNCLKKALPLFFLSITTLLLSGCNDAMVNPKGEIAVHQIELFIFSVIMMLIVVIPVFILVFWFAVRYRADNKKAKYSPEWAHNVPLELIWWGIPLVIIVILGIATWITSHTLSPYRPLATKAKTLTVEVVALNWKWLFIYPKQNIATVNYLEIPVNTPVQFLITADAPMNSFIIPQLAGQIYAMTGMQTQLHVISDKIGSYTGLSVNYSGNGFAGMRFETKVTSANDFKQWLAKAKQSSLALTPATYTQLAKDSSNHPVTYYGQVQPNLFKAIMQKFTQPTSTLNQHDPEGL